MADKSKGLGLGGVFVGLILIFGSFYAIYQAALRKQASDVLGKPVPIAKAKPGRAFYATGTIIPRKIGDNEYLKTRGPFIELKRSVQVYGYYGYKTGGSSTKEYKKDKKKKWKKKKKSKGKYKCKRGWIVKPRQNKAFKIACEEKENRKPVTKKINDKKLKKALLTIKDAASGKEYSVEEGNLEVEASARSPITKQHLKEALKEDAKILKKDGKPVIKTLNASKIREKKANSTITGAAVFDAATCDAENLKKEGCQRIVYSGIAINSKETYTVLGGSLKDDSRVSRKMIGPMKSGEKTYIKLCKGTHQNCLAQLSKADTKGTKFWLIGSIVGFFIGMILFTMPLTNLIQKIPIIGGLGKFVLYIVFFVLSLAIMLPLYFALKYWYAVIGVLALLIVLLFVLKKKN